MSDYKQRFENYRYAFGKLSEGIFKFDKTNDLQRDGLIQRFEFTFELSWKTLKAIFDDEGLIGLNSPKTVLREAFSSGLIEDDELWLLMLNDRNSTSHVYSETLAIEICNNIITKYRYAFEELIRHIQIRRFE